MKRKYLSALLMGTLTVASMSTFTSCKDYDDDISNLQGQIDKLATADQLSQKVAELQALISSNKSDITSLQAELAKKTTLDEVKAVLADYATKQYVDAADKTLQDAIDALKTGDIAKLKEDVVKAQAAADKAADDAKAANAEIVETLKTLATKTELKDAAKAAQDAIDAVKSENAQKLKEAQDAITETLKSYATKSDVEDGDKKTLESLASTIKNASDALALANTNKQAIADALDILGKGYSKENTVAAAIEAIQGQIGTPNKELGTLDSRLAAIESVLNGVKDDDTKLGLATKVTNIENQLKDIIGEYTTMVTAVSLYKTDEGRWSNGLPDDDLTFIWVPSEHTTKFPADKNLTDAQIEFSADHKNITITDSLVVRVSPTNAELTPANISLINSQGKELNEFVDVQSVKPYKKLITGATRAANATEGNGLWTVTFKLKDGVDIQKFEEATISQNSYVQFAVAVKNTTSEAKESPRRVVSAYSVDVKGSSYEPANNNILVQGNDDVWKDIRSIRNRFGNWHDNNVEKFGAWSSETGEHVSGVNELEWAGKTPYTADEAANHTQLAKNNAEIRAWNNPLPVTVGKKINIALGAMLGSNNTPFYYNTESGRGYAVKGFYVTLDKDFAIESAPSELNAWAKYSYENVGVTNSKGTITKAAHMFYGNEGYITINSLEDTEVKGDIIGFRVFAVNFDGTLVDPDGRAFYVKVGDAKDQQTVAEANATITATASGSQYFKRNGNESNFFANITTDAFNVGATQTPDWTVDYTNNPGDLGNDPIKDLTYGNDFNVKYYNKKGKEVSITSGEVASAKVFLLRPQRFVDGGTYTIKATLSDNVHELRDVTLKFTKVMPTAKDIKALKYVDEKLVANNLFSNVAWTSSNIYKFYQNPANDGSIYEKVVSREMSDYVSGLVDEHYTLWFESLNVKQSKIAYDYSYSVDRKNIDGKEHAISYAYDFGPISLTHSYVTGEWLAPSEYVINAESNLKMLFNTWLNKEETWAWQKDYTPTLIWNAGVPVRNQKVSAANIIGTNSLLGRFNDKSLNALFDAGYTQIAEKNGKPYVSFSNPAFDVTVDVEHNTSLGGANNITFVFNQTTKTTVPDTSGTLTIGVEDCFGQVKVITLGNIKIDRQ
jgi:putative cell surface protein